MNDNNIAARGSWPIDIDDAGPDPGPTNDSKSTLIHHRQTFRHA
jgi:hypothetical protein